MPLNATHDDVLTRWRSRTSSSAGASSRLARLATHGLAVADRRASARTWLVCSNAAACCACCSGVKAVRRAFKDVVVVVVGLESSPQLQVCGGQEPADRHQRRRRVPDSIRATVETGTPAASASWRWDQPR